MATRNTTNVLIPPKAPNLLNAPTQYSRSYIDQLLNVLRLYFNTIDNTFRSVLATNGGSSITFPHISASDTTDQHATANDTATIVLWNTLDSGSGWTLNSSGTATAGYSGVYTIRYSLQFANTDNAQHDATVWLRVNGVDVTNSATVFSLQQRKSAGVYTYVCGYSEATFQVETGDEIALYWATDKANIVSPAADGIYIEYLAAQTSPYARPAVPSAIGSITFVSALY